MSEEKKASVSTKATADKEDKKGGETQGVASVPTKFKKIVEEIEKMSVLDLSELVKILEDKFGVSAAAPTAVAAAPGAAPAGDAAGGAEEKSEFDVELTDVGSQKIAVIKVVKEIAGVGLADAKKMTEEAPKVVKEKAPKKDAEEMKKKLEEAGAKVTLK